MTSEEQTPTREPGSDAAPPADSKAAGVELWVWLAVGLAVAMVLSWIVVFLELGLTSVRFHVQVIPTLGFLTFPLMAWGLFRALLRPPAIRRPRIVGFVLLMAAGWIGTQPQFAPPLATEDFESSHTYRLPFEGEWVTLAGGDDLATNVNAISPPIRWAYDFTVLEDGKKYQLDGEKNEDYHCFGRDVLAPVDGKVVRAVDDIVDNTPGEVTHDPFGNQIVLRVDESEYLFLSHLKHNSIAVESGAQVRAGQKVGECGNSGYSLEPHLKVHLQDRLDYPVALGLPLRFSKYRVDGEKVVEKGMPVGSTDWIEPDGQRVENIEK